MLVRQFPITIHTATLLYIFHKHATIHVVLIILCMLFSLYDKKLNCYCNILYQFVRYLHQDNSGKCVLLPFMSIPIWSQNVQMCLITPFHSSLLTPVYCSLLFPLNIPTYNIYFARAALPFQGWDTLEQDLRHCPSFTYFKSTLKSRRDVHITPLYLLVGDRKWNILQTRLRCHASALNSDLYRVNLTDSPFCQCGNMNEDAYHFLFECTLYTNQRVKLYHNVMNYQPITNDKLLSGDPALSYDDNIEIVLAVQEYIKNTERFWFSQYL